jgi:hypothetical protein
MLPSVIAPWPNLLLGQPASYRADRDTSHDAQADQKLDNLCRTPAHQRQACLSRAAARQGCGLCPHLRGKNAAALLAGANPQCFVCRPTAFATCGPSNRCSPLLGRCVDCSTPGGRKPTAGCERVALCLEDYCALLPTDARTALLQVLIRFCTWAWVHAFFTSKPSIVLKNRSMSNSVRIYFDNVRLT